MSRFLVLYRSPVTAAEQMDVTPEQAKAGMDLWMGWAQQAGNALINARHPQASVFHEALRRVTQYLAREMARDGEGATKLMTVNVRGARDKADAVKAARTITVSPLWQCALAGGDPNWGRIVAALGASGCDLDQDTYDAIVRGYAEHYGLDLPLDQLKAEASEWSITRGSRSGRVAWQFIQDLAGRLGKSLS